MEIRDAVALTTGGASGLGLTAARWIVAASGRVVLLDLPGSDGAAACEELGSGARFSPGDVTSEEDVRAALDPAA